MTRRFRRPLHHGARAALSGAALVAFLALSPTPSAVPRDEVDRLAATVADLQQRLARVEGEQASAKKSLEEIAKRLDDLARASRTAELRLDLDALKREVEALAHRTPASSAPPSEPSSEAPAAFAPPPVPAPPALPAASPAEPPQVEVPRAPTPAPARPSGLTGEDLYSQAHRDYIAAKYDAAEAAFREFLEADPDHAKAPNAQYWIGECRYSQKRFEEAREAFAEVVRRYPGSAKARAAQLKVGFCHLAEGNAQEARACFQRVAEAYPGTDEAQMALERLERLETP